MLYAQCDCSNMTVRYVIFELEGQEERQRTIDRNMAGRTMKEGGKHLAHIHAVHQNARHAKGGALLVDVWLIVSQGGACGSGVVHANRPLVVLHHKDTGQLVKRCHVQALVKLSCGTQAVAQLVEYCIVSFWLTNF